MLGHFGMGKVTLVSVRLNFESLFRGRLTLSGLGKKVSLF